MPKKVIRIIFISLFFLMIVIPLVATFFQHEEVAVEQNRMLVPFPNLWDKKGHINRSYTGDFEEWIDDHIGFRRFFVELNGRFRYRFARGFSIDRPLFLGPEGELNYAYFEAILDYQHKNLYPDDYLQKTAESLQKLSDYAKQQGAEFFYYQCWDKHSVYPEYFPKEILQYGDQSKTDGIVKAFREQTDANIISPKEELIKAKDRYDTYSTWGDPTHWTQRGAYIGYLKLMEEINDKVPVPYRVLEEDDYKITWTDQGLILYGNIHREDMQERFEIKDPEAEQQSELLTAFSDDPRTVFYTNEAADNDSRLVIIGDSYFYFYIMDDLAESFRETVFIWGDHLEDYKTIIDEYQPDIVIVENAEREDRTGAINSAAKKLP